MNSNTNPETAETNHEPTDDTQLEPQAAEETHPAIANQAEAPAPRLRPAQSGSGLPTGAALGATRSEHWHQAGNPLLSIENVREWLNRSGLVLYASRTQLGAPAPSLVEATLGESQSAPTLEQTSAARSLLTRLIADGAAVPLNLMGAPGGTGTDVPDFVVSAGVFSYIFTLRGNKAWKQAPSTSGAVKISPLALAAYDILTEKVTLSAYDLATLLGKEVTETAVLRSLTELWGQLRVIPVPQQDGSATLWELATGRFTKQIKAGANAGQPSALSALVSLYLAQALVATEDEIESFLSPLAPRSRVRDVLHALLSARQLETLVIDGKTLLHVTGDQPSFLAAARPEVSGEAETAEGDSRISKFASRPGSKLGTGLRSKPAFGSKPPFGRKPAFGSKSAFGAGDRERRPFKRDDKPGFDKPRFDKPWQENRPARPAAGAEGAEGGAPERKSFAPRSFDRRPDSGGSRPSFGRGPGAGSGSDRRPGGDRPQFGNRRPTGDRPQFGSRPGGDRPQFGNRPGGFSAKPRFEGRPEGASNESNAGSENRPPRRDFTPRPRPEGGFSDGPRKTFSKPGTFGRKREGFAGKPSFGSGDPRPPRRNFGSNESRPPRRDFAAGDSRPPRPDFNSGEGRPAGGGFKTPGSYAPRPGGSPRPGGFGARPSFARDRNEGASGGGEGAPAKRVFRKFDAPRERKPFNSDRGGKPAGGGGFKKPGGFAGAGGPFAKFADGKKPFRKPGPGKPKPAGGGFTPVRRRPEGNQ